MTTPTALLSPPAAPADAPAPSGAATSAAPPPAVPPAAPPAAADGPNGGGLTATPGLVGAPPGRGARAGSRRALGVWLRRLVLLLGGLALGATLAWAWRPKPTVVDVAQVRRGSLRVTLEEAARARVKDRYTVSTPLGGNVLRLEWRPGDRVEAGAVLARILPTAPPLLDARTRAEAQARVAAAAAAHRQSLAAVGRAELLQQRADHELDEARRLERGQIIHEDARERAELEARLRAEETTSARFAARMAAHEAAMASVALRRMTGGGDEELLVTAPVPGVVLRVLAPSGGVLQAGTPLVELGDPAALEVISEVLTSDAVRIRQGSRATLDHWGGEPLGAHVRLVEPSAFTRPSALGVDEQRVTVILDLDDPRERWAALGDGYRLEARLTLWERDGLLIVPEGALFRKDGNWSVFTVEAGKATPRRVRVGQRNGVEAQIEDGLREDEVVIVYPGDRIAPSSAVVPRLARPR